ncbi:ribosomal RNA methyltransferase MRM2 [Diplogelasinospora grovesii]|uniref:rRNA methyltransferase 2, mitochondrial n=1 Tax=Diplogelasinospora grovesii TaxID=303347 RepID=A0AAN6S2Z7_9PEZI|nr:ribosomal RNA methyltransferase MRM2 [Diplogelasinospora grovesii]
MKPSLISAWTRRQSCRLSHSLTRTLLTPFITHSAIITPVTRLSTPTLYNLPILLPTTFLGPGRGGVRWSSSNSRWKARQGKDSFAREARVQGLKSRAAFKLLEMDARYHFFSPRKGQVVVDLGYAPGSWSQVALERTKPDGRVLGIDLIPAQPPKGVSTIQGNFLSAAVQGLVKEWLVTDAQRVANQKRERKLEQLQQRRQQKEHEAREGVEGRVQEGVVPGEVRKEVQEERGEGVVEEDVVDDRPSYIDMERHMSAPSTAAQEDTAAAPTDTPDKTEKGNSMRLVDVVLSDMSDPWPQTSGFRVNSVSNPYLHFRMMNTSGITFKDHAGSMDLCRAALSFANDTLRVGGHFVCKFYQGQEDKAFEMTLKKLFAKVHREKPESSRSESREAYFVALRRKDVVLDTSEILDPA